MSDYLEFMIETLQRGTAIIEPKDGLSAKLTEAYRAARPLRIKLGFDPTAPDLHLGHAVVSKKLRQFQDFGHQIVVIIGDYTARRGDPTGRKDTRPPLTKAQVDANAQTYLDQLGLVLDLSKVEIHRNSKWFANKKFGAALDLAQEFNIARLFERKDFGDRYRSGQSVTLSELMYPGLQGRDSVEIRADIEIGGTDQLYNLLVGRDLQRGAGQEPQIALCMPILPGTDGIIKMSKSKGNYIGLTETPEGMFQKIMALKDKVQDGETEIQVVRTYVELLVTDDEPRVKLLAHLDAIETNEVPTSQYVEVKKGLAFDIVRQFHGLEMAEMALQESEKIQKLGLGSARIVDVPQMQKSSSGGKLVDFCREALIRAGVDPIGSNNPRKLIENGAVKINGEAQKDPNAVFFPDVGTIVAIGKKLGFRISNNNQARTQTKTIKPSYKRK